MLQHELRFLANRARAARRACACNVRAFLGLTPGVADADSEEARAVLSVACGLSDERELLALEQTRSAGAFGRAARRRVLVALGSSTSGAQAHERHHDRKFRHAA